MESINFLEEVSNFIFTSKYARYNEELKRRETWDEAVFRLESMHLNHYSFLSNEDKDKIKWAFSLVKAKRVVPSMRSLQYGGKAIEAHNARIYNCAVRHVDSLRSFSEIFYLLLCGCGVGIGLSKQFLSRLPNLVSAKDKTGIVVTYTVEDSIEGWSDSIEALLNCYFKNTPYTGRKIVFDYSKIRPKGSVLKTGGGKAPGYKGLKQGHLKIKALLDHIIEYKNQTRLKSVNAYDILMHCADSVLSGGCRRSATSVVFDKDDTDMLNAKTFFKVDKVFKFHESRVANIGGNEVKFFEGKVIFEGVKQDIEIEEYDLERAEKKQEISWRHLFPQRARSNNSVLLLRDKTNKDDFKLIIEKTKQFGEPGFVFGSNPKQLFNPCLPAWTDVLTKNGIVQLKDIKKGDEIWSKEGWTKVLDKWSTGIKKVLKYTTTAGTFYGTDDHKIVSNGEKIEVKNANSIDIISGMFLSNLTVNPQDIMDGLVLGDGSVHKASNNLVHLCIGKDDQDYFSSEIKDLILKHRPGLHDYAYEIKTTISFEELPKTYKRTVPSRFYYGDRETKCGFLRGLFSANGSISGNRITLKTSSRELIEQVQVMLSSLGIVSYYTTNKSKIVSFNNGDYKCKESYDLNISKDKDKFAAIIGFIQSYKMDALRHLSNEGRYKTTFDIISVDFIGEEEVFDITVDNNSHTFWNRGCDVSNCFEIGFVPVTEDGICGVQFCNLTSINGRLTDTEEKFKESVEAYTIIGTLQAGYTNFPYLSGAAENLTRQEALLGCSITGMMDNPKILLDPKIQRKMAKFAIDVNKEWAEKIGIKQAARITCVKPEGTSSLVLGTGSGIHPHHARRYFRRVQNNKLDNVYKFFKKHNPQLCEPSIWSANQTDDVVTFPIEVNKTAMVKSDLSALEHLEIIKSTQQNWVIPGITEVNTKNVEHNVSCTVIVKDDEWESVIDFLYENRQFFAAVSLISSYGDKSYPQSPMEAVTPEDIDRWEKIVSSFKPVNYQELTEKEDQTSLQQEGSCYGGQCEIKI